MTSDNLADLLVLLAARVRAGLATEGAIEWVSPQQTRPEDRQPTADSFALVYGAVHLADAGVVYDVLRIGDYRKRVA